MIIFSFLDLSALYTLRCPVIESKIDVQARLVLSPLTNFTKSAARRNSRSVMGTKKALFLDKEQKKAPLSRVTIVMIFARNVDTTFALRLYDTVCNQQGDVFDDAVLPCVIDTVNRICYCDFFKEISIGDVVAVKNKGIRVVKNIVFNGRLPIKKNNNIPPFSPLTSTESDDTTIWQVWKKIRDEGKEYDAAQKKQFQKMKDNEVFRDECNNLTVKYQSKGVVLITSEDKKRKTVSVQNFDKWTFPKTNFISKQIRGEIKRLIENYYSQKGYSVWFTDFEDMEFSDEE